MGNQIVVMVVMVVMGLCYLAYRFGFSRGEAHQRQWECATLEICDRIDETIAKIKTKSDEISKS